MVQLGPKSSISLVAVPSPWQERSSHSIDRQQPCSALQTNVAKEFYTLHSTDLWIEPPGKERLLSEQHFLSVSLEHPPADKFIMRCSGPRPL